MRSQAKSILLLLLVLLLSACGTTATGTEEVELANVYTAAASTLTAQQSLATQTRTPTAWATATLYNFPTSLPVTPTVQSAITVSYSSASTANGCNNSIFISDVTIPDGTVLAPGESFTKTWELQNTGSCAWSEEYLLTFVSGNDMDGETTEIDQDVAVSGSGDISIGLVAPSTEGTYTGYWRLADEDGNAFGQSVYVMIVVSEDAATLTPTPTSTTETTDSDPTSTSEPTATTVPTQTSTATLVPTTVPTETSTQAVSQ